MTWAECEQRNRERYKEVFIVSEFGPDTYGEWYELLKKIEPSPFIRDSHAEVAKKKWHCHVTVSRWETLYQTVKSKMDMHEKAWNKGYRCDKNEIIHTILVTAFAYSGYSNQIKRGIERAPHYQTSFSRN